MSEPTPDGVTVTIEPKPAPAPEGVYDFTLSCPHRAPFSSEYVPSHISIVHMGGIDAYAQVMGVPFGPPHRPTKAQLVNTYMEHMSYHGDTFDQCPCWERFVMQHGTTHENFCPTPGFSRQ